MKWTGIHVVVSLGNGEARESGEGCADFAWGDALDLDGCMIRIREIDHLVLRVVDLDRMLHFYCDVLGCTIERRQESIGLVQLRAGRSLVDLVPIDGELGSAGGAAPGIEVRNLDHSRYGAEGEGPPIYVTVPRTLDVVIHDKVEMKQLPAGPWHHDRAFDE